MEEVKTQSETTQTNQNEAVGSEPLLGGVAQSTQPKGQDEFKPYELTPPQNYPKEFVEEFHKFAISEKLPQETAQKLLQREADRYVQQQRAWNELVDTWTQASMNDKEFGGVEFQKNLEIANRALKKFGSEALIEEITRSGFCNHPEFIRLFYRIGKAMSDDEFIYPKHNVDATPKKSIAEILYPSLYQQNQ